LSEQIYGIGHPNCDKKRTTTRVATILSNPNFRIIGIHVFLMLQQNFEVGEVLDVFVLAVEIQFATRKLLNKNVWLIFPYF